MTTTTAAIASPSSAFGTMGAPPSWVAASSSVAANAGQAPATATANAELEVAPFVEERVRNSRPASPAAQRATPPPPSVNPPPTSLHLDSEQSSQQRDTAEEQQQMTQPLSVRRFSAAEEGAHRNPILQFHRIDATRPRGQDTDFAGVVRFGYAFSSVAHSPPATFDSGAAGDRDAPF